MNQKVKKFFSETINDYDTVCDLVVQENSVLQSQVMSLLEFDTNSVIKVLDLGCGYGAIMKDILARYPHAHVTGIDFSERMLSKARNYLSDYEKRHQLIQGDIIQVPFGEQYDVILSTVTLHNLAHSEKFEVFSKIVNSLKPEGLFVNGDFIQGETEFIEACAKKVYLNFIYRNLEGAELKAWINHITNDDQPMKLSEQFRILESLQMRTPEVRWLFANQAVYSCRKL